MKQIKILSFVILLVSGISLQGNAQCVHDPIVTGDTLLCPNSAGLLTTQVYDTYQWYKRPLFGGTSQPIPGAVSQTINVDAANNAGYYFSVEASLNGCVEMSPEVLVDSWVFLLPYTIIEGDYTIGGNGEIILCQGDTVLLICGSPYDTNIQWFDNGNPLNGANNDTLFVTGAGSFTFSGAPSLCPNFLQNQFIPVDVVVITCPTGIEENQGYEVKILPNPAADIVNVSFAGCEKIELYDVAGKLVFTALTNPAEILHEINVSGLSRGNYTLRVYKDSHAIGKLLFKK